MQTALKGVPVAQLKPPAGVTRVGDDWLYDEYAHGGGITNLGGAGLQEPEAPAEVGSPMGAAPGGERNRILDLFKN